MRYEYRYKNTPWHIEQGGNKIFVYDENFENILINGWCSSEYKKYMINMIVAANKGEFINTENILKSEYKWYSRKIIEQFDDFDFLEELRAL